MIAATSTAANVSAIAGGILVFGDPMPADALGIIVQLAAFALVIVAAALVPPPVRAAAANTKVEVEDPYGRAGKARRGPRLLEEGGRASSCIDVALVRRQRLARLKRALEGPRL